MSARTSEVTYVLGRSAEEERRLQRQARLPDPITRRLFEAAGIGSGMRVLDLGSGAGDVAMPVAEMVGPAGHVVGVDMTGSMLARARTSAHDMGIEHVELHEALIESLPLDDASVDVVISNGVLDLVPDKRAVFDEIDRVLRPGGRLQLADVVIHQPVSEDARERIDLWTG
jgi:ubiquinone/menaquinone biosynthesis C-methylase UbiE